MFRVGQKVVFIGGDDRSGMPVSGLPVRGVVYTVTSFRIEGVVVRVPMIELAELVAPPGYATGFNALFFRPAVDRPTDISVFTEILDKARKVVEPE